MPSVSRQIGRLGLVVVCGALLAWVGGGCSTTEEKAEHQKARAEHILKARAQRQKQHTDGTKSGPGRDKSAHRPQKNGSQTR